MPPKILLGKIAIGQIAYDHETQLFFFSPRCKIDQSLVARLKHSIRETGNWQPIVIRAGTLEGVAGNHRFLAIMEIELEAGHDLQSTLIPVVFAECDEGTAVTIALAENEHRVNLTQWETVRGLINAADKKPAVVKTVFNLDSMTIEQLRLWGNELDHEAEIRARQNQMQLHLTREWVQLIHTRLNAHPNLQAMFLSELSRPNQIHVQSLDELDRAITHALLEHGHQFDGVHTWNSAPTFKCLGCRMNSDEFEAHVADGSMTLSPTGIVPDACPHLRVFTQTTPQFIPDVSGTDLMSYHGSGTHLPPDTLTGDNMVRGRTVNLLNKMDAYCVEPAIREAASCFHEREEEAAQAVAEAIQIKGLPSALPSMVNERQHTDQFIWLDPILNQQPCTPETCLHRHDTPPGFVMIAKKGSDCRLACVHMECGGRAKIALNESEVQRQRHEREQQHLALDVLRQRTIEQTLFLEQKINVLDQNVLGIIEMALVPNWDGEVMTHVLIGWQSAMRSQIANKMGLPANARQVTAALREHYGEFAEKPTTRTILRQFKLLRSHVVETTDLACWIACLAVARGWKDRVKNPALIPAANSDPMSIITAKSNL